MLNIWNVLVTMLHKRNLKHQRSTSLDTPTQDEKTNPHLKTSLCLRENSHITSTNRECGKSGSIDWYPMLRKSWGGEKGG